MNDSRMSTCLISTSTSYCWRSEVWLPLNRLPGRRSEDEETGKNLSLVSKCRLGIFSPCATGVYTYSVSREGRSKMTRDISHRCWCGRRERRGLRRPLVLGAIVGRCHRCWDISVGRLYACARWLAMCLGWRLIACAMWRRRGLLLYRWVLRKADIIDVVAAAGASHSLVEGRGA